MGEGFVDLHVHSNKSDGTWSPSELVAAAKVRGLRAIALTDHDTVDGLAEAHASGEKLGVEIVDGIELSTELDSEEIHILGYLFDKRNNTLQSLLARMQKERASRIDLMVDRLRKAGYDLTLRDVEEEAGSGVIGRPHLARVLVKNGYVSSVEEAFNALLDRGKPGYVPRPKLKPVEAIEAIRTASGIPVLAHPGLSRTVLPIREFVTAGLLGIEVYYAAHDAVTITKYLSIASHYGLVPTGGSDSHGPKARSGHMLGQPSVSYAAVRTLYELKAWIS